MDQDESMDDLTPLLGYGCGFCSAFLKDPDMLGFRVQGNLAIAELEAEVSLVCRFAMVTPDYADAHMLALITLQ